MTNFKFAPNLLTIISDLVGVGINDCHNHEARTKINQLFNEYNEQDALPHQETNNKEDLERFVQLLSNLDEDVYNLWFDEKVEEIKPHYMHLSEGEFVRKLYEITGMPYDSQEYINLLAEEVGEVEQEDDNTTQEERRYMQKLGSVLKDIENKEKKIPKELKEYYRTMEDLKDEDYPTFLDEASGEQHIIIWEEGFNASISVI